MYTYIPYVHICLYIYTYIRILYSHTHTLTYPNDFDGARRRCRAAHVSAGQAKDFPRACTGTARKGTRRVLKTGARVLRKGVFMGTQRSGEAASGSCGSVCGSACTPQEWPVWYGSTYRVLTACSPGYSRRTVPGLAHQSVLGAPRGSGAGTHTGRPRPAE